MSNTGRTAVKLGGLAVGAALGLGWAAPRTQAQYAVVQIAGTTAENPLTRPVFVTAAPGDYRRVFILEKRGRIRVLDITTAETTLQAEATPFLDIRSLIPSQGSGNSGNQEERGLLGLAFHPQYMTNGKFYVYYTTTGVAGLPNSATYYCNVVEYTNPTPTGNVADAGSARILMQIPHPQTNHNGGWIAFGPDGYLYIAVGDGGGGGDDEPGHTSAIGNGQDTSVPLGKIMRIDVDTTGEPAQGPFVSGAIASYGVPADNPTLALPAGAFGPVSRREIWAYGLRNPWRPSFDRATGDLWIADVGQGTWEEIDFQPALTESNAAEVAGRNYGWRCFQGTVAFNSNGATCPTSFESDGLTGPVGMYTHGGVPAEPPPRTFTNISGTCAITGGYVYRGCAIPELVGSYVFTDYCTGRIYTTSLNGANVLDQPVDRSDMVYGGSAVTLPNIPPITRPGGAIVSFGEDAYGELYMVDQPNARIFKFVRTSEGAIVNANCDVNFDGQRTVQDIFDFLSMYFTVTPNADFNRSGSVTVQDIFDFLACYFSQCPH